VYNNVRTIAQAIESVLSQTYPNIEYIIIDGGSTDGTLDVINRYQDRLSRIINERDKGLYDAMNKGINFATGDVIGFLNSDDLYFDQNIITDIATAFTNDEDLAIIFGNLVYVKQDNVNKIVRNWISKSYNEIFFERGDVPPHPTLFVRKDVYAAAGVFNLNFMLAADYELMLRIFKNYEFKSLFLNRTMVKMRLGGKTNQSISNIIKGNREILLAWKVNGLKPPILLMPCRIFKRIIQFIR
jgi:glycosyltransferase involved in cell wall biosynthesis